MNVESIIEQLQAATNPEAKAALVAEAVLGDLPKEIGVLARRCGFLHWFNNELINALIGENAVLTTDSAIKLITSLPFIEPVPMGYSFHLTTRQGLLNFYKDSKPDEIIISFKAILPTLLNNWDNDDYATEAIYALIVSGRNKDASEYLDKIIFRFSLKNEYTRLSAVFDVLEETEKFSFVRPLELSALQFHIRGYSHAQVGRVEKAITDIDKAIELYSDPLQKGIAYSNRGQILANINEHEKAIADFNAALSILPDGYYKRKTLANRAQVFSNLGDYKKMSEDILLANYVFPEFSLNKEPYLLHPYLDNIIDKSKQIQMLTVKLQTTGNKAKDVLRMRRIHGTVMSYPGEDRFGLIVYERGTGYLVEFPNFTTGVNPELIAKLEFLVGSNNVKVRPIKSQSQ